MPPAHFQFRPLSSTKGPLGVVGFAPDDDEDAPSSAAEGAIQSFIDQAAVAIERTLLVDQAAKAETSAEAERLRASLLSSVSHDLKTPLASIVGSVTSLRQLGAKMPKRDQDDLLATIEEEAERLSLFVSNLLDMTKIEAGALDIRRETIDIGDALRDAVDRARAHSPARTIEISVDENLPHVRGDSVLIQQVFFNLLDNANKYSDPQSVTRVIASREQNSVSVTIADSGIGIPPEALKKVFAKFFRVAGSDGRSAGTGLGLSIAAGIVEAMGGTIYAESPIEEHKGTRIIVSLPAGSVPHQKVQDRISLS
jgi:two-component system sensor histidine kinase KdpD